MKHNRVKVNRMGREAKIEAQLGDASGACTVLLEAHELILRGAIKAKLLLSELSAVQVQSNGLHAGTPCGALWLGLSERMAQSWFKKMHEAPPTLASKLGISTGVRVAFLRADVELEALVTAQAAEITALPQAHLWLARLDCNADLSDLLAQLVRSPLGSKQALWVIRRKGMMVELKEATVMRVLRALALVPTKTASVSESRTADRYVSKKPRQKATGEQV
jgi:hypothetical protein